MTALEQSRWLQKEGHQVLNLVSKRSELSQQLKSPHPTVAEWDGLRTLRPLRQRIGHFSPNLVIYQQLRDLYAGPLLVPKATPQLGYLHMFLSVSKRDPWHRFLYRQLQKLIVLTPAQKENALARLPVSDDQIVVLPNGVDRTRFGPVPKSPRLKQKLGWRESDFLVGVVGRMDPQKGQMETLEALQQLHSTYPRLKVVFVGEDTVNTPGTAERMKSYIRTHHLEDSAKILPFQENIEEVFSGLDLFLMPSYGETFGRVLIEAMASGVPVVGTRAGGVVDLIADGKDGLLAEPRSADSLVRALQVALEQPEQLEAFRQTALQKVARQFDLAQVRGQTLQLFDEIARSHFLCN